MRSLGFLRFFFIIASITSLLASSVSSFVHTSPLDSRCVSKPWVKASFLQPEHTPTLNSLVTSSTFSIRTSTPLFASDGPAVLDKPEVQKKNKSEEDTDSKSSKSKGWAVRLYNDPMNKREFVARCLTEVCALSDGAAYQCMMQAHQLGIAVIGCYHLEMAELYRDQLTEHGLMIDMVPADDE